MTLKELFIKISPNGKEVAGIDLIPHLDEINKCDEFIGCNVHIINESIMTDDKRKIVSQYENVFDNFKFKGDYYLYSILLYNNKLFVRGIFK